MLFHGIFYRNIKSGAREQIVLCRRLNFYHQEHFCKPNTIIK